MTAIGIDVGAARFHLARLDPIEVHVATTVDAAVAWCAGAGASAVAIDAPSEPASGRIHPGVRSPKFAAARCNEIAAGEQLGVWVPWVTPVSADCPAWMRRGFELWDGLRAAGHDPVEVYPAGMFWLLNGRRWPPRKSSPAGRAARLALLEPLVGPVDLRSHDAIDAVMAAVVAREPSVAIAHEGPDCDGSSLHVLASSAPAPPT